MNVEFARRAREARASEIRELLKFAGQRDIISFGGGLPPNECFPLADLEAAAVRVLRTSGPAALQYSQTEGYPPLRAAVAARAAGRLGMALEPQQVLITAGSQQALDLTGKVFLDEGDALLCESPTYLAAIGAFRAFRPRFVEVPSDDEGMVTSELAQLLARTERARFIYVIPDFQNPSGRTWSRERRSALLDLAARAGIPIVEDSPYAELRFEGTPLPSIKAMDRRNVVVHLGTFSKILSPGLRVGWMTAPAPVLEKYVLLKQGTDLNTSTFAQQVLAAYLELGDLDGHIELVKAECRRRRDAMVAALERELPGASFTRPHGGLFLWVELPESMSARTLLKIALDCGVAFPPGGSFFPNGGHDNTLRLAYSDSAPSRIEEGIRRLGLAYRTLAASAGCEQSVGVPA